MKRFVLLAGAWALSAHAVWAQPDATTDVDATTTPVQQSPLAPEQARTSPPRPLTIEELITGKAPYQPSAAPTASAPVAETAPPSPPPASKPQAVFIDEWETRVRAVPTATDIAYEASVLSVFQSAQGKQGALDGRWRVEAGGRPLYTLQFADPGAGEARIEGAWRNPGLSGPASSGFVDEVARENDVIVVRFSDVADRRTEIRLTPTLAGSWTGEAIAGQDRASIVMVRDQGVEVAASAVPAYTPAPPPPAPKATPAPARKPVVAKKSPKPAARSRASAKKK